MTTHKLALSFILYATFGYAFADEYMKIKPDYIKTCKIKEPGFIPCSTESIQMLFAQLSTGIEGLDNVQIDPMKLSKIKIFAGDGPVSINSSLSKAVVTGFANAKVVESDVSPVDYHWVTKIYLPKMRIEGNYNMKGRILVIPLNGHGSCLFEPSGMDIILYTKTHLYEKFGHIFYNITETHVDFNITGLKLRLNNLFDGVKVLEESTNKYLNENWRPVSEALKPIIAKTIEDILLGILNKIFHFMPAEYLVSDIAHPSELYGNS